jgi:chloramphenicol-sensitive protein RarD
MQKGILFAICSYIAWGLFPLYFKAVNHVAPTETLSHRVIWAMPFLLLLLARRSQWAWLSSVLTKPKILANFIASALTLSVNWFVYIWAVTHDHIIDGSLGYFINPIVNILFGFIFLKERLRLAQWIAVGIAASGVLWLALLNGHMPWISLILAISFGAYALLRKIAALEALEGLALETLLLFPGALAYVIYLHTQGESMFTSDFTSSTAWLLIAAGPITAIPLLFFAAAARLIPMSTLGILQYIAPSLQLLVGAWIYNEPFNHNRLIGFVFIWSALFLYSLEGWWRKRQQKWGS